MFTVYEVEILNKYEDVIGGENIVAGSEAEMWDIFDNEYRDYYPDYDNAVIVDSYPA